MSTDQGELNNRKEKTSEEQQAREYVKPKLAEYGKVESVTGGTQGSGREGGKKVAGA